MKKNLFVPILTGVLVCGIFSCVPEKEILEGTVIREKYVPAIEAFDSASAQWNGKVELSSGEVHYFRRFGANANSADLKYDVGDKVRVIKYDGRYKLE